jgi:hypothetical protein
LFLTLTKKEKDMTTELDVVIYNVVTCEFVTEVLLVSANREPMQDGQPMKRAESLPFSKEHKNLEWFVSLQKCFYIGVPKLITPTISTLDVVCAAVDAAMGDTTSSDKVESTLALEGLL